jgi:hypothetical protein
MKRATVKTADSIKSTHRLKPRLPGKEIVFILLGSYESDSWWTNPLTDPKVHCRIFKSPSLHYILWQLNSSHILQPHFFNFFYCRRSPFRTGPPHYRGITITLRHTTLSRTLLDEWSARRRDLYLTTHNTHNRHIQVSMPPAELEPTIPAIERPRTYDCDRTPTGTGPFL